MERGDWESPCRIDGTWAPTQWQSRKKDGGVASWFFLEVSINICKIRQKKRYQENEEFDLTWDIQLQAFKKANLNFWMPSEVTVQLQRPSSLILAILVMTTKGKVIKEEEKQVESIFWMSCNKLKIMTSQFHTEKTASCIKRVAIQTASSLIIWKKA